MVRRNEQIRAMGTNISKNTEVKIARTFAVCDPWMAATLFPILPLLNLFTVASYLTFNKIKQCRYQWIQIVAENSHLENSVVEEYSH